MAEKPELPPCPDTLSSDWNEQTRAWWAAWDDHPNVASFTALDWLYLIDTAMVHHDVWTYGNLDRLPELRTRMTAYGVTAAGKPSTSKAAPSFHAPAEPAGPIPANVTPLDAIRAKLAGGGA